MSAPPVYTQLLGEVTMSPGSTELLSNESSTVQWVVTDIAGRMVNDGNFAILGCIAGSFLGVPFAAWQCPGQGRRSFHWRGRQVIGALDSLQFQSEGVSGAAGTITIRVTGYVLTLP